MAHYSALKSHEVPTPATAGMIFYSILPCIMRTHAFVSITHSIIIPMVYNHYTHVQCASLFSPKQFRQKSVHCIQQNAVCEKATQEGHIWCDPSQINCPE